MSPIGAVSRPMTGDKLRAWRKRMDWIQAEAAEALDISLRMFRYYETGEHPVPHAIALACAAIELGIEPE